jgi:dTDP-4-dehydrorhamnose reductase
VRLLVVGGTGYLGRAVARAARARGHDVVATGSADLDLRGPLPPIDADAVVNAAYVQRGPDLQAVTVDGAIALADACAARGTRLVQLSSDLVFGGRAEPYGPDDPVDPLDDYGRAKAAMEQGVLAAHPGALVVRTSLLWGASEPGAQERLVQRACAGEPVVFYTSEVRCPIEVDVLARRLVAALDVTDRGIVHVAGTEALDRLTFARRVAARLGLAAGSLRGGAPPADGPPRAGRVVLSSTARPWGTG